MVSQKNALNNGQLNFLDTKIPRTKFLVIFALEWKTIRISNEIIKWEENNIEKGEKYNEELDSVDRFNRAPMQIVLSYEIEQ